MGRNVEGDNPDHVSETTIDQPKRGELVQEVYYQAPENGWTVIEIAPIPPESRMLLGGREITHIVKGSPYGAGLEEIQGVGQDVADKILNAQRGGQSAQMRGSLPGEATKR